MKYQIDQSGKIEQTNKPTIVACVNGTKDAVVLSSTEKKKLLIAYRSAGTPRLFAIQTFSILIFLVIKPHLKEIFNLEIDKEYPGYGIIRNGRCHDDFPIDTVHKKQNRKPDNLLPDA